MTLPTVSIAPAAGSVLSATTGTWNNEISSYAYQWLANGTPIPAATAVNYTTKSTDAGKVVGVNVTATGPGGSATIAAGPMLGWQAGGPTPPSGNPTPFTALHTYFMAANGNDACNGTSAAIGSSGACAWKTPNHAVVCGDVIIAAAGAYNAALNLGNLFGTVTGCPSTTGGIDGTGGVYFAVVLCGGVGLGTGDGCYVTDSLGSNPQTQVQWIGGQHNWAVEGFTFNSIITGGAARTFESRTCGPTSKQHHLAAINNVIVNSMQGFAFNDCGDPPDATNNFTDYVATVGNILQNANQNGDFQAIICVGAIDYVGLGNFDTAAGTHAYMYTNYGISNQSPTCASNYDGWAFYIDSPQVHSFSQTAVISNNIGYQSTRGCIALTSFSGAPIATFKIDHNTCFNDNADVVNPPDTSQGELNYNTGGDSGSMNITVTNNIFYVDHATSPTGTALYAVNPWWTVNSITLGATSGNGQENVFKATRSSCVSGAGTFVCDAGNNILINDQGTLPAGTNFFVDPVFTDTTDLLANHVGIPNCTGFTNTTACMGWNANTSALTTPSVISDLAAGCGANCTGRGFQRPSTTCAPNADFPAWLKGIVYLHWTGTAIVQNHDLATTPCGL